MRELITIEEIARLNGERTSGDWYDNGNEVVSELAPNIGLVGGYKDEDIAFIAAAPRIAAKAIALDKMLTALNQNMDSVQQTNDAALKRLAKLDKVNKELVEALRESVWQMKRMSTILTHHGISGGLFDTDGPIKRAELALKEAGK